MVVKGIDFPNSIFEINGKRLIEHKVLKVKIEDNNFNFNLITKTKKSSRYSI